MKYIVAFAFVVTLAVPASAEHVAAVRPVLAKTTASQRALAQTIAGRITSALDAEPFPADKSCKKDDCTASLPQ